MKIGSNNTKIYFGLLLLFLFLTQNGYSQSRYQLNPAVDYTLIGLGALSLTTGQIFENGHNALTICEINNSNPENINRLDRNAVFNYSESARMASDVLLYGSLATPLLLLAGKEARNEWITIGVMGIEVLMITSGITTTVKSTVLRSRPYVYNPEVSLEVKQDKDARYSFFSGHTAVSASMTFFAARVFSDLYPDSKWKPVVWSGAILLPIATAVARVESGKHFPTDVIAGYAVGAAIGYFIPVLHLKKETQKVNLHIEPSMDGFALRLVF